MALSTMNYLLNIIDNQILISSFFSDAEKHTDQHQYKRHIYNKQASITILVTFISNNETLHKLKFTFIYDCIVMLIVKLKMFIW